MIKINGNEWKLAIISGANNLMNKKNWIDSLNVFPVPDGDTGSNMSSTVKSGIEDLENENNHIGEISKKIARNMLLGARGNSGVILSQIFQGFAVKFENKVDINTFDLVNGFSMAKEYAYNSVLKPVEGTILTIIKDVAEELKSKVTPKMEIKEVTSLIVEIARKSCDNTPNLLPILKEVGVNDSGGEGLFLFLEGMDKYFSGYPVEFENSNQEANSLINNTEIFDGEFGYCTEFIIELKNSKKFVKKVYTDYLQKLGSSLVVVQNEKIVKIHIHSLNPGKVLSFSQKYGEFIKIKCENMTIQADTNRKNQKIDKIENENTNSNIKTPSGIVSCNVGQGLIHIMKEYGCDFVIEAGQSSNPSAADFIKAIKKINSDNIFILPNNPNIILAAQQAAQIVKDKKVYVIPTKTQMEGISAIINFNKELDPEDNKEEMEDTIPLTKTGAITNSIKSTKINNVKVNKDDFIGLIDRKVVVSTKSLMKSAKYIVDNLISDSSEILTIYYGADSSEIEATELKNYIESNYDIETIIKYGGQPIYNLYISVEE